jgi:hypothetical protein
MGKEFLMKKRLFKWLTAAITAMILAVMTVIMPVSASFYYNGILFPGERYVPTGSNNYASETVFGNGTFWFPNLDAYYEFNTNRPITERAPYDEYSNSRAYFDTKTGNYVPDNKLDSPYVYYISRFTSNTEGDGVAYKTSDGDFYPTLEMANEAGHNDVSLVIYQHRGAGNYFNKETGRYYSTLSDALNATGSAYDILLFLDYRWLDRNYTEVYYSNKTHKYYLSEAEAKANNNNLTPKRSVTSMQGYYFNRANGNFYLTAALAAQPSSAGDVIRATSFSFANGIMNSFGVYPGGVGQPIYTPLAPDDAGYSISTPNTDAASMSPYDQDSTATLRSNYNYKGWAEIADLAEATSAGANIMVYTNQDTYVSSTFMRSVAGRDINVTLVAPNGATIRFSGLDIYNVKDVPISVVYNAQIPTDVYRTTTRAAKADSSSTFTIGADVDLGVVVKLTVRFNASRENDTASVYHYHADTKKATLVDSKTIGEDGATVFELREGGQYIVCITEN